VSERVVVYQLSLKFVQQGQKVPAQSKQLIHYTLAIGHHIGVIDCFSEKLSLPYEEYKLWLTHLKAGTGCRKFEGLLRFGEIEIAAAHVPALRMAIDNATGAINPAQQQWTRQLLNLLDGIEAELSLYLLIRRTN